MKSTIAKQVLAVIILISSNCIAQTNYKQGSIASNECLVITGKAIDDKNEAVDGATVILYKENDQLEWDEVTNVNYHDHNFKFTLDADSYYTIEVSKPGYVTRSIGISTKLPSDVSPKPLFRFEFDVELFKENTSVDHYYFDFPVALICYNAKTQVFEDIKAYTKHIKSKIKESEEQAKLIAQEVKK